MRNIFLRNKLLPAILVFALFIIPVYEIGAFDITVKSEAVNACQIGSVYYATLDAALEAVPTGEDSVTTVKMLKDFTDNDGVSISKKKIELNLNGYALTINNPFGSSGTNNGNGIHMQLLSEVNVTGSGKLNVSAQMAGLHVNQSKFTAAKEVAVNILSTNNIGIFADTSCVISLNGNVTGATGICANINNVIDVDGTVTATGNNQNHAVCLYSTGNTVKIGSAIVTSGAGSGLYVENGGIITVGSAEKPGQVAAKGYGIWSKAGTAQATITVYGNVEGTSHGIYTGDSSIITVYGSVKSTAATGNFYGVYCNADSKQSEITVNGNAEGTNGVYIRGAQSKLTVNGNVKARGTDAVNSTGAYAAYAKLYISGSITASGCIGAYSFESAEIVIDGTIEAAKYIKVRYTDKTVTDADAVSTKAGYRQYSAAAAFIWVKEAVVIEVGNSAQLFAALGSIIDGSIIKLIADFNYSSGILIDGKSITFDLGSYTLNISSITGPGLEVKNGGQLKLVGTGAFNVESTGTGNTGIYNGVVARAGSKATVTNARTTNTYGRGAYAEDDGAVITVLGNVESTGFYGYGVQVWNGGNITVNGTVTSENRYATVDTSSMSISEGLPCLDKPGYIKYGIPGNAGAIWIKVPDPTAYVCEINGIRYTTLDAAIAAIPAGGVASVNLLRDIHHNSGVVINGIKVTFVLNGYTLSIVSTTEGRHALVVSNGGCVYLSGEGALNVTGPARGYGVTVASNTLPSAVTVTNAAAVGTESKAAHAYNRASLTVLKDVTATGNNSFGVHAQSGAAVEVKGNVSAGNQGVCVSGATAKVAGNVLADGNDIIGNPEGIAVNVYDGIAEIGGSVTASRVGAMITAGGSITVDGILAAPDYIQFADDAPTAIEDYSSATTKAGYRTYQHTFAGIVWIKEAVPVATYVLTVINGTGDGDYEENEIADITADAAPAGKVFDKWITSDGISFQNASSLSTKLNMPAKSITVTATYKDIPDIVAPTGEISVGRNKWNSFWNTVTFGLFCKSTQTVNITASDNSNKTVAVRYYLSETELTPEERGTVQWLDYSGAFSINPNSKQIIYVKLIDASGNTAFINSAGIVLYTDSAMLTDSISHVRGSGSKTAEVVLNGNVISKVINGSTPLISGTDYSVSGGTITLSDKWLDSLSSTSYTLTVCYKPMGVEYSEPPAEGSAIPAATSFLLTVTDSAPVLCAITVMNDGNGSASGNLISAAEGTVITLTASPKNGYRFKEWKILEGIVTIENNQFYMPDSKVTIKAIFELIPTRLVTVNNGTGGGSFPEGVTVNITAQAAPEGKVFDKWETADGIAFADDKAIRTSFVMPGKAVTVSAVFKDLPPSFYLINVRNDGNGTANAGITAAAAGTEVILTATPNDGYRFAGWEVLSGGITVNNNKFYMPAANVTVKAIFIKVLIEVPDYKIIKAMDGIWYNDTDVGIEIICDGDFIKFTGVKVDGTLLSQDDYNAVSGSTVVTFKPEFLATLTPGDHIAEITYTDGSVKTVLKINKREPVQDGGNPQTGDSSHTVPLLLLILTASTCMLCITAYGKKKQEVNM